MKKTLTVLLLITLVYCKPKKVDLSGNKPLKANEFLTAFPTIINNFYVADTNVLKVIDTTTIGINAIKQFVPDSVLGKILETKKKYNFHPIGKIEKPTELYLLAAITQKNKTETFVFVFDKLYKYVTYKQLLITDNNDDYIHALTINKEPTFLLSKEKINAETKQLQFTRQGWAFSNNSFMVVVNDSNEDEKKLQTIINPIDTLPRKNKLSGEYMEDSKNFMSIRDGKNVNTYLFFIHFEKKDGQCIGELKGNLVMKSANKGIYNIGGDPCIIDFEFKENEVRIKEQGSCGNRRGIDCFFKDTFIKKKEKKKKIKI